MADAERPALLIVDDDPLIAEALSYFLERDFLVADSRLPRCRRSGSPTVASTAPHSQLVDLGLPPIRRPDEGFALITELLGACPEMRIFVLSGQDKTANARHAPWARWNYRQTSRADAVAKHLLDALRLPAASGSSEGLGEQTLLGESPSARALRRRSANIRGFPPG